MKLIYNGKIISSNELSFDELYRAIFFGDGFFESIYADDEYVYFLDEHLDRILEALEFAEMPNADLKDADNVLGMISNLLKTEKIHGPKRIRILAWRKGRGTYTPDFKGESNYLILSEKSTEFSVKEIRNLGLSSTVRLGSSSFSGFKSVSALDYVMASLEKNKHSKDELLLTDNNQMLREGISSNVIFLRDRIAVLPAEGKGQVQGIMLDHIMKSGILNDYQIIHKETDYKEVSSFDSIIFCNSFTIKYIYNENQKELLEKLNDLKPGFPKLQLVP